MAYENLLAALGALQTGAQPSGHHPSGQPQNAAQRPGYGRLAQAMGGKRGMRPGDAKYAGLAALSPYAVSTYADRFGGSGTQVGSQGAFQDNAFQDDAYQVFL